MEIKIFFFYSVIECRCCSLLYLHRFFPRQLQSFYMETDLYCTILIIFDTKMSCQKKQHLTTEHISVVRYIEVYICNDDLPVSLLLLLLFFSPPVLGMRVSRVKSVSAGGGGRFSSLKTSLRFEMIPHVRIKSP